MLLSESVMTLFVSGCQGLKPTASPPTIASISGIVRGGQQPVAEASIQLYAAGTGGDGSAATPLLTSSVTTNSNGAFSLTGLYVCPSAAIEVYLVAAGGNPGLTNGGTNTQISLTTALGPCGNLTATTSVEIDEVTTVASTYALAPYMQSYSAVGSSSSDAQMMADAFTMAAELANTATGATPGVGVPADQRSPPKAKYACQCCVCLCQLQRWHCGRFESVRATVFVRFRRWSCASRYRRRCSEHSRESDQQCDADLRSYLPHGAVSTVTQLGPCRLDACGDVTHTVAHVLPFSRNIRDPSADYSFRQQFLGRDLLHYKWKHSDVSLDPIHRSHYFGGYSYDQGSCYCERDQQPTDGWNLRASTPGRLHGYRR